MGSVLSSGPSTSSASKTKKPKKKSYLTWKEQEGSDFRTLINKTKIKLGESNAATYCCIAVTNESISKDEHETFEWKIIIHKALNLNDISPKTTCCIGFMDAEPPSNLDHKQLCDDVHDVKPHYFSAKYVMSKYISSQVVGGDVFTFNLDFLSKTVTLSYINGVKPTKKLFPDLETKWNFKGNQIYPAVSKNYGVVQFSIYTKYDSKPKELIIAEAQQPQKALAIKNRMYDMDEKEGFGNKFKDRNDDIQDIKTLLIYKSYKINSPNSITWKIEQENTNYRIDWGVRGSFCGLGIGRRRYVKAETGQFKVLFHFGFIFNGNDYTLTDIDFNSEFDDKHWMLLHLWDTNNIGIELCGSATAACNSLSEVWRNGEFDGKDYQYYRLNPGFCITSVKVIADVINKEKQRKYELCYKRTDWTSITDLNKYTNCMLFVIRMCKICNMKVPEWKEILRLFTQWEDSDKFAPHWNHFRKYAKP